jgi:hypothetical protein
MVAIVALNQQPRTCGPGARQEAQGEDKPKPTAKRPEDPIYKHPQAIRAQWLGQAKKNWYRVLTREGKALGWTPSKLQEAMNSVGIVPFVHAVATNQSFSNRDQ